LSSFHYYVWIWRIAKDKKFAGNAKSVNGQTIE
jgi:hypothetical protein